MFREYQLRRTSATSRSRSPSTRPQSLARGRGTTSGSSLGSAPSQAGLFPTGHLLPGSSLPRNSEISLFDEPITTGVRRRREEDENDPTCLSPQRVKRLKIYAKERCNDLQIPDAEVIKFIELADLFRMLVDIKMMLIKNEFNSKANELQVLQETISSKDFESSLHNRLLACMLSPNLTAYVTDTQRQIMDFILQNLDVFKIPAGIFDDVELRSSLGKTVTKILATIRSHIKTQLTMSIAKGTCIIDVTRGLARSSSGMEVEAPHWARMAFLRRCLRLFLIGSSDYKVASAQDCFTHYIIPSLKPDMRRKLEKELSIDISQLERALPDSGSNAAQDELNLNDGEDLPYDDQPIPGAWQPATEDADADFDIDTPGEGPDELDESDSGFGLEGKRVRFSGTRFWNYVDYMLNLLWETVRKEGNTKEEWDAAANGIIVLILLQDDLAETPGSLKKSGKLMSVVNPQWQTTIQEGLIW